MEKSRDTRCPGNHCPSGKHAVSVWIATAIANGVPGLKVETHSPSNARDGLTNTRPAEVSTMLRPTSVVESVFSGPRSYVEIVAGCNRDGRHTTTGRADAGIPR